jgi:hypothetical protein
MLDFIQLVFDRSQDTVYFTFLRPLDQILSALG